MVLIERLRRRGFEVDVRALFATPTVAELAATLDGGTPVIEVPPNGVPSGCARSTADMLPLIALTEEEIEHVVATVPGGAEIVQDIYSLAPLQEGILFHHRLGGDGDPYLLAIRLAFDTGARLDNYLRALQAIVDRHDILDLNGMARSGGTGAGCLAPGAASGGGDRTGKGDRRCEQALYARFDPRRFRIDVRQAPLLRLYIAYDSTQKRWLLMLLLHHLAGDHTTLEVIQAEIQAQLLGEQAGLPAPLPFRNLVAQARLGVSPAENEAYFRKMLGDVQEPTAPFGLLMCRATEAALRRPTCLSTRLWPDGCGLMPAGYGLALPVSATWLGRRCWPGSADEKTWSSARLYSGACKVGKALIASWDRSSTPCRCASV